MRHHATLARSCQSEAFLKSASAAQSWRIAPGRSADFGFQFLRGTRALARVERVWSKRVRWIWRRVRLWMQPSSPWVRADTSCVYLAKKPLYGTRRCAVGSLLPVSLTCQLSDPLEKYGLHGPWSQCCYHFWQLNIEASRCTIRRDKTCNVSYHSISSIHFMSSVHFASFWIHIAPFCTRLSLFDIL